MRVGVPERFGIERRPKFLFFIGRTTQKHISLWGHEALFTGSLLLFLLGRLRSIQQRAMPSNYQPPLWIFFLAICIFEASFARITLPPQLIAANRTSISLKPAQLHNSSAVNFRDLTCYHLSRQDDFINEISCQGLFAELYRHGDVYDKFEVYNEWQVQFNNEPCVIKVANPIRGGRVKISPADLVTHAIHVLRDCTATGTGGAYTFQDLWEVIVTRRPIKTSSERIRSTGLLNAS